MVTESLDSCKEQLIWLLTILYYSQVKHCFEIWFLLNQTVDQMLHVSRTD